MKAVDVNSVIKKKIKSDELYKALQNALSQMCDNLAEVVSTIKQPMGDDLKKIITFGGKRLRPILAFMCYRIGGKTEMDILPLMFMLELFHTASLIHDDVVDGAGIRRDIPTINSIRGNSTAIQSGDFLLAKAMELLHVYRGTGINEMLADVSYQMCMGELQQQSIRFDFTIQSRDTYFDLINKKTAALLAASCFCGAIAGGMDSERAMSLYRYGERLGIAFQLRDDLLDYYGTSGKTAGQDLLNGIFTLPILELRMHGVPNSVYSLFKKRDKTEVEILKLTEYIKSTGALEHAEAVIWEQVHQATCELREFTPCPEIAALNEIALAIDGRHT